MAYRIGVELELLAPRGITRADLADRVAATVGGRVVTKWHYDSERTAPPASKILRHLTPAFYVEGPTGRPVVRIVDDLTIRRSLDRRAPSPAGWQRVMASDRKLLEVLRQKLSPGELAPEQVEAAIRPLRIRCAPGPDEQTTLLLDADGDLVAWITDVPGERARVAELVSPVINSGADEWLELVTAPARDLGFTVPAEGATHFHYDADLFRDPQVFRRLVRAFTDDREELRRRFATNPNCKRLGPLPNSLRDLVESDGYDSLTWREIIGKCRASGEISKFADVNLLHLLPERPKVQTVEFRLFPSSMSAAELAGMRAEMDGLVDQFVTG